MVCRRHADARDSTRLRPSTRRRGTRHRGASGITPAPAPGMGRRARRPRRDVAERQSDADRQSLPHVANIAGPRSDRAGATGHREYVFTDQAGQPLSQEWLHKLVWLPTIRHCGLHARGQYNIRDTFITNALSAGEDPGWVAQVCGTSEQMIFRHYSRWMPALSRTDGRRIAALFGPPRPPGPPRHGHQDGHRRGATTTKSLKSQRAESGGGGNRTPVRRLKPESPPVTMSVQVRGIPATTIRARTRNDQRFPQNLERFWNAA